MLTVDRFRLAHYGESHGESDLVPPRPASTSASLNETSLVSLVMHMLRPFTTIGRPSQQGPQVGEHCHKAVSA